MAGFGAYSITDILNGTDESLVLTSGSEVVLSADPDSGLNGNSLALTQGEPGLGTLVNSMFAEKTFGDPFLAAGGVYAASGGAAAANAPDASAPNDVASAADMSAPESQGVALVKVTTRNDVVDPNDGQTSLREAIMLANANANADPDAETVIYFDPNLAKGAKIVLSSGELFAYSGNHITINGDTDGDGRPNITISGNKSI